MRPTSKQTGAVWVLLKDWAKHHPLDPNQRQIAGMIGVSDSLLTAWKYCESTMQPDEMAAIVRATTISLDHLARAVVTDRPRVDEWNARRREHGAGLSADIVDDATQFKDIDVPAPAEPGAPEQAD